MSARWRLITDRRKLLEMVVPINDLRPHDDESPDCWCQPKVERLERWVLIVHNAEDGRELVERHGLQ